MCKKGSGGGGGEKKKKTLCLGAFNQDVGGGHDMLHVWDVAFFCHQTHTNVTLSSVSWCVSCVVSV